MTDLDTRIAALSQEHLAARRGDPARGDPIPADYVDLPADAGGDPASG